MLYDYKNGIYGIDAGYEGPGKAEIFMIRDGEHVALIETAHNAAFAPVLDAMLTLGVNRGQIEYIFLSHVHLDHAGGAGLFMKEFPNAKLVVHERGARHMISPEKLIAGVKQVYGEEETIRMYGEILPVNENRVIVPKDGTEIKIGSHTVVCMDTPGHAKHHLAYYDKTANVVFAGDIFGISYLAMADGEKRWAIPTTSPVQFDPEVMNESVRRVLATGAEKVYLTHFGEVPNVKEVGEELIRLVDAHKHLAIEMEGDFDKIEAAVRALFIEEGKKNNWPGSEEALLELLAVDINLNAQGLSVWYENETRAQH